MKITYRASADHYYRSECDFDISEESDDRETAISLIASQLAREFWSVPICVEIAKAVRISEAGEIVPDEVCEDGEIFTSGWQRESTISDADVQAHPSYVLAIEAKKAAKVRENESLKEAARMARLKVYEEVKKELEATGGTSA